jgi:hypothetical protein
MGAKRSKDEVSGLRVINGSRNSTSEFPRPEKRQRPATVLGVVQQVRVAFGRRNRLAATVGAALGSIVPLASYWLSHHEVDRSSDLLAQLPVWLVAGGLLYSALTVFAWGRLAFGSGAKALGFCVLLEGVLLASQTTWLSVMALCYLIAINGIATGCSLAKNK